MQSPPEPNPRRSLTTCGASSRMVASGHDWVWVRIALASSSRSFLADDRPARSEFHTSSSESGEPAGKAVSATKGGTPRSRGPTGSTSSSGTELRRRWPEHRRTAAAVGKEPGQGTVEAEGLMATPIETAPLPGPTGVRGTRWAKWV